MSTEVGSVEFEGKISLINSVIPLSWRKLDVAVDAGSIGVLSFVGRLEVYPAGTIMAYRFFVGPPWRDRPQHAILFATEPKRLKITVPCDLPGLGTDPAWVDAVVYFRVARPERLLVGNWREDTTGDGLNRFVNMVIVDAVNKVVQDLGKQVAAKPSLLTLSGTQQLEDAIVSGINLEALGLQLLPERTYINFRYPPSLLKLAYDLKAGILDWETKERKEIAELERRGIKPSFDYLLRKDPSLLDSVIRSADSRYTKSLETVQMLISTPNRSDFYKDLLSNLLKDLPKPGLAYAISAATLGAANPPDRGAGPAKLAFGAAWEDLLGGSGATEAPDEGVGHPEAGPLAAVPESVSFSSTPGPSSQPVRTGLPGTPAPANPAGAAASQFRQEEDQALQNFEQREPLHRWEWYRTEEGEPLLELTVGKVEMRLVLGSHFREKGPEVRRIRVGDRVVAVEDVDLHWRQGDHVTKIVQMSREGAFGN